MARYRREPEPGMLAVVDLEDTRPKGAQLREILLALISTLKPGDLLPSERVLADLYRVARLTVRQEVDRLVTEGLVRRHHGQGTFVASPKLVQSDALYSFSEDMRARGIEPGGRVISVAVERASRAAVRALELERGARVISLVRIRTADGEPMAVERTSLPAARFPGLETLLLDNVSLWDTIEHHWGVQVGSATHTISSVLPDTAEAQLLEITTAQPCFAFEGTSTDTDGRLIEYGRSVYRGDRYDVQRRAVRPPNPT
ncbi:GntR family transcriptional regulator [Kribbella sp. NPDC026611]|uniref:GntR family transcriptional regulator n=1 Tax=Kribbella sp. NPDC026611 TaxID=3154911 RepID=UPI0034060ABE